MVALAAGGVTFALVHGSGGHTTAANRRSADYRPSPSAQLTESLLSSGAAEGTDFPSDFPSDSPSDSPGVTDPVSTDGSDDVPTDSAPPTSSAPSQPVPGPATVDATDGDSYDMRVYGVDRVANCAVHSYGAGAHQFLRAHPCQNAHRLTAIVDVHGRRAVLSVITVTFGPTAADDGSGTASDFADLEKAPATGGMNDLIREGHYLPGVAHGIPPTEAFEVYDDGGTVAIFDAWWLHGHTDDQDSDLVSMEDVLFPSSLTPTG